MLLLHVLIAFSLCLVAGVARAECRQGELQSLPERALVHLPAGAGAGAGAMPLLILLHGSTGTGAAMLRDSQLTDTADRHGFMVAAPDGGIAASRGYVWNIPGVPAIDGTVAPAHARDDVAYLTGLIDRLADTGCVDTARVYVTGFSGGGRMASWLGCVAPQRFAAIVPVVGLRAGRPLASDPARVDPATCRPQVPLQLLAFAGDADTVNPIGGGGAGYWQYDQAAALQRWAALNGCAAPYARNLDTDVYEQGYARCRDGASVAVRVKRGGRHAWSVVDNEALWDFLSPQRR